MSHPRDLLGLARHLARREPRRPRQASLRRAVSTAYYALFHLLSEEVARLVCKGNSARLEPVVRRALDHTAMKEVCKKFAQGKVPPAWGPVSAPIPDELKDIARTFIDLQENRHTADYDFSQRFSRRDVDNLLGKVERSLRAWRQLRTQRHHSDIVQVFLLALLLHRHLRK